MSERVVVVTGASAGIGRAVVRLFAQQERGIRLGLIARGKDGLQATQRELEELGAKVVAISCDVADAAAVERAAVAIEEALGPIDVWINNAMVSMFARVWEMRSDEIERVTRVTYLGAVNGTLAALRRMKQRDHGVIVQVGSLLEVRSIPLQSAYCAAKHALAGFTESLRVELMNEKSKVKVSTVQLPAVNTPQFSWVRTTLPKKPQPMGRIYQPEVAARAIVAAASGTRPRMLAGGSLVAPWVAQKFVPRLLDAILAYNGVEGQMSDEPIEARRRDNLFFPVPGDAGAHGSFDARATSTSLQVWTNTHRGTAAVAAGSILAAIFLVARLAGGRRRTFLSRLVGG